MNRLPQIDLWKLARMKGDDFDETCEDVSCDRVASAVVMISHWDGRINQELLREARG